MSPTTAEGAIVDFGQVLVGRVRLRVRGTTPGQRIVIEHTETLAADGSWFANIVGINKEQTDVFLSAGGDDEWEPEFTFHGFRYARVSGLSTAPLAPRTSSRWSSRAISSRPGRSPRPILG